MKYFLDTVTSIIVLAAAGLAARTLFDFAKRALRRYPNDS